MTAMLVRSHTDNLSMRGSAAWSTDFDDLPYEIWRSRGVSRESGPTRVELIVDALRRVKQLQRFHDGWNGREAKAVDPKAAVVMVRLIQSLVDDGSPDPQISPLVSGGLSTTWLVAGASIELDVEPDLSWTIFAESSDGKELLDEEFEQPGHGRAALEQARKILAGMAPNVRIRRK